MTAPSDTSPVNESRIAELMRTRPEAFDFADCPDTTPLSPEYKADMYARMPAWLKRLNTWA